MAYPFGKLIWKQTKSRWTLRFSYSGIALVVAFACVLAASGAGAVTKERLSLDPAVLSELTAALNAGDALHNALAKQDDEQVDVALRDIELAIVKTKVAAGRLKEYQRTHLVKLLDSTEEFVEVARNSSHSERRARLVDIFNNLANFVRIYNVDARFKIFFCGRDRLTWVQTSARGQHPMPETLRDPASERADRDCAIRAP